MPQEIPPHRLAELRKAQKVSRAKVARHLEVVERTVERWETTAKSLPVEHWSALADFFEVSIQHLLGMDRDDGNGAERAA